MPSLEAVCGRLFEPRMDPEGTVGRIAQFRPHSQCARTWIPAGIHPASSTPGRMGTARMAGSKFPNLFAEGLRAFLILLAYVGIPLFAGWLLSEIVDF